MNRIDWICFLNCIKIQKGGVSLNGGDFLTAKAQRGRNERKKTLCALRAFMATSAVIFLVVVAEPSAPA